MASAMPHRPQTICDSDRTRIIRSLNDSGGTWKRSHLCPHSGKYRGRAAIHGRVQSTGRFKRASARCGLPPFGKPQNAASLISGSAKRVGQPAEYDLDRNEREVTHRELNLERDSKRRVLQILKSKTELQTMIRAERKAAAQTSR